jgi:hypothetical protein
VRVDHTSRRSRLPEEFRMTVPTTRTAALFGLVITAVGVVYTLAAAAGFDPSWGFALQALIHIGELAVVLALFGALGAQLGALGRIGFGVAALGQVLLVVAELVFPFDGPVGEQIFNFAPLLSGLGMVLAGIAVLRSGVWRGWHRVTPLLVGAWMLVVVIPLIIVFDGPPATAPVLGLAGWDLSWALAAIAVLTESARERSTAGRAG